MPEANIVRWIRDKFIAIVGDLDERGRRRWAAAEARSLGRGGIAAVAEATGLSDRTIRNGIQELDDPSAASADRQRRPGAGRPSCESLQRELIYAIESLVEAETRPNGSVTLDLSGDTSTGQGASTAGISSQQYQSRAVVAFAGIPSAGQPQEDRRETASRSRCTVPAYCLASESVSEDQSARDLGRYKEEGTAGKHEEFREKVPHERGSSKGHNA